MSDPTRQPEPALAAGTGSELPLEWRVHTSRLLEEIIQHSGQQVLTQPLRILGRLLAEVGERAIELDDAKLNALMCRLTIYTVADPDSPDYDPELLQKTLSPNDKLTHGGPTQ